MSTTYCFDRFEVQPVERRLLVDGQPAAIGARAFDLLRTLLENPGRLLTKSELLDRVWPGLVVEEANLHVQVSSLRKLLGPKVIATIPGQGYKLAVALAQAPSGSLPAIGEAGAQQDDRRHNLPEPSDALIGREADLEALNGLLDHHRLVTAVGASGIGKTRLAQAAARQRLERHADGVWWVDLAALRSADQIAPAVARAAGLALGEGDALTLLRLALEPRDTLIVLDNCEHLVEPLAALAATLLDHAPRLRLLATSIEPLKVRGEQLCRLEGLAVPPGPMSLELARCFASVQLLERRAQAVDHRFRLTDASVAPAIELCRQLDGIALAIEMAAGRLPTLGLEQTLARLGDRLRLLRSTSRAAPARHQTLGATLEWSHALLAPAEQAVLRRLSVFAGSFHLDAALAVAAAGEVDESAALDALFALVDKSLLQLVRLEPPRYRLLETTRLFAAQRLDLSGEAAGTRDRHCQAMGQQAVEMEHALWQMADRPWLQRYLDDADDLQCALEHAVGQGDAEVGAALAAAGAALDLVRGTVQGRSRRLAAAAALLPSAQGAARATLLELFASAYASKAGDSGISRDDAARELVDLRRQLGDSQRLVQALGRRALVAAMGGDLATAGQAMDEGRRLEQGHWPPRLRAWFRNWVGGVQSRLGDVQGLARTVGETLVLAEQGGLENSAAMMQAEMFELALLDDDLPRAVEVGRKAVVSLHRLGMTTTWALTNAYLCSAQVLNGEPKEAAASARLARPALRSVDLEALLVVHAALLAAHTGRAAEAARLVGWSRAWYAANGNTPDGTIERLHRRVESDVAAALGSAESEQRHSEGAALGAEAAGALLGSILER